MYEFGRRDLSRKEDGGSEEGRAVFRSPRKQQGECVRTLDLSGQAGATGFRKIAN
jgi:hypothetical protein